MSKLYDVPVLDLGDYYMRKVKRDDCKDIYEYTSDKEVTKTLMFDTHPSIDETYRVYDEIFSKLPELGKVPVPHIIIDKKCDKVIGMCNFVRYYNDKNAGEIGYALNRSYWSKGIMTIALKALVEYGFNDLNYDSIIISHMDHNVGSKRVIEKNGFKFTHKEVKTIKGKDETLVFYVINKNDYLKEEHL